MNQYSIRRYYISAAIIIVALALLIRLFYLQIIEDSYKQYAYSNSQRVVVQYPARGLIYDRNGKLVVSNRASYDLMVVPGQVRAFDTTELCSLLSITPERLKQSLKEARSYSKYIPSVFVRQISPVDYAMLQEKLYRFSGFFVQSRSLREYNYPIASHLLGYVGEADNTLVKTNPYYAMGDYVGISGVEKTYEDVLRGEKGHKIYTIDVHGRIMGSYLEGREDKPAVVGKDITISMDALLQQYGEQLMVNKIGSIVAIEPSSGEILALISSPTYHPGLLVGRERAGNYEILKNDKLKPLFNRALMAKYPPGSTFKIVNALIALQEGLIQEHTTYTCYGGYVARPVRVGCHSHPTPLDLPGSIQCSCNSYYCNVFRKILTTTKDRDMESVYTMWHDYVVSFGFGSRLYSDLPNEVNGFIPKADYYHRYYGKKGWSSLTIISLAIGQGELGITPLQMANMTAAIANRGFYYTPHIIKKIAGRSISDRFKTIRRTPFDSSHIELVIRGMELAVNGEPGSGSTARIAQIPGITVCGKTGTAQNPHGKDHSIFIAFAPKDNPQIAIAVYVENAGFGSTFAAPIASLMIEKYLTGEVKRGWLEERIMAANLIDDATKD